MEGALLSQRSFKVSASSNCICETSFVKLRLTNLYQLVRLLGVTTRCLAFVNSMGALVRGTPRTQVRSVSCH